MLYFDDFPFAVALSNDRFVLLFFQFKIRLS